MWELIRVQKCSERTSSFEKEYQVYLGTYHYKAGCCRLEPLPLTHDRVSHHTLEPGCCKTSLLEYCLHRIPWNILWCMSNFPIDHQLQKNIWNVMASWGLLFPLFATSKMQLISNWFFFSETPYPFLETFFSCKVSETGSADVNKARGKLIQNPLRNCSFRLLRNIKTLNP